MILPTSNLGIIDSTPDIPKFVSNQIISARRFYLNLKPRKTKKITVICGGYEECAADYEIKRQTFPFFSIEFVAAGKGTLILAGKRHALEAGSVFTYAPGVSHEIFTESDQRLVKYFVDFIGSTGSTLMRECGISAGSFGHVANVGVVRDAFDALIRLGLQNDRYTERTCALQLELLACTISRSRQHSASVNRRARATYERVRSLLDSQFLEFTSIDQVAVASHLDSAHLSRLVRRFQSESPLRYLQRRRMQWAADRLQNSSLFIREVADELRMDPFHFSRMFKRVHGISPTAFLAARAPGSS
jgi:AraC-like DNA-binding protein